MKREYRFYGWETADVKEAHGLTPRAMYDLLSGLWCAETCAPRMRGDWSADNRTLGQCSVTAFLIQDLFGGKVYGIPLEDGGVHCFNEVDGRVFDLTSEQFGDVPLCYADRPEQHREEHFRKAEKKARYERLREGLLRCLEVIGPEPLLEIRVLCEESVTVRGGWATAVMIPFTGTASGPCFTGEIGKGGVDTQIWPKDVQGRLSARYTLQGRDRAGQECRIFIQNEGNQEEGYHPMILTDSGLLSCWERLPMRATIDPAEGGVLVRVFAE